MRVAGFGRLPDGTPIAFALANGYHATFSVIEVPTGRRIFSKEILGTTMASWVTQAPDGGDIYLSAHQPTPAALYRFDVSTMTLHHVEDRVAGEETLYGGVVDAAGRLWFGTSPHAKLMCHHPDTGTTVDLGRMAEDATHVYTVGLVDDRIWVGTGPVPHLYQIDPDSGARKELHPPAHVMAGTEWFIGIAQRNRDVLVRLAPAGHFRTAVFHTATRTWSDDVIEGTRGGPPTPVSANGTS